jgi:L-seryl-tRNA(Ser) seleniumtransferase
MIAYGLPHEPLVGERITSGVDIVTFSGDKLLGGPQAGIIVGKAEWIEKMRKNPMMRALRVDKLIIAGLSATLQLYLTEDATITERFPMLNRYTRSMEALHAVATELKTQLEPLFGEKVGIQVSETYGQIGSGALPVETLPSIALVLEPSEFSAEMLAAQFRNATIPVIGRIKDGLFWLDLRTVYEREQAWIVETATQIAKDL